MCCFCFTPIPELHSRFWAEKHSCRLMLLWPLNAPLYVNSHLKKKTKKHWPFDANSRWMLSICSGPGFAGVSVQNSWHLAVAHSAAFLHQLQPRWVQMCSHLCLPFPTIAIVVAKPAPPCQKCVLCAAARYYTVIKYLLDSQLRKASCCAAPFNGTSGRL